MLYANISANSFFSDSVFLFSSSDSLGNLDFLLNLIPMKKPTPIHNKGTIPINSPII
jgi:hypothetical protein